MGTYLLEAGLGRAQVVEHGPAHAGLVDVGVVLQAGAVAHARAAAALVARLVEVRLGHQDQRLDRHQHLRTTTTLDCLSGLTRLVVTCSLRTEPVCTRTINT